jgi:rRNA maturation endonuclease Nob1|tara:strand:+ start:106 stop:618 length:513 start_codon:yes stop_codon:yes gene_type:complete
VAARHIMSGEVLDTGALISWSINQMNGCVVTPSQREEILKIAPEREVVINTSNLIWKMPDEESLARASKFAIDTGDMAGLSKVDLELLALSIQENKKLITDDYRLQNLAEKAGINWGSISTKGISKLWEWELKCLACKKEYPTPEVPNKRKSDWGECIDCGSSLKLKRKK